MAARAWQVSHAVLDSLDVDAVLLDGSADLAAGSLPQIEKAGSGRADRRRRRLRLRALGEGVERGLDGRHPLQVGRRHGHDRPPGCRRDRQGHDVAVVHGAQDEVGDQRDAEPLGDQAHDGDVVLGLVGDVGAEAGVVGQLQQVTATAGTARRSTARPRGRRGRRSPGCDTAWPSGHREAHLVVEQRGDDELVEVLLAAPEVGALVGEGHREVALAGLERREALRRLGLGEA